MTSPFMIRKMEQDEVAVAVSWADREGWNPGIHDGTALFSGNPDGMWVAEEEDQVVGMVSGLWLSSSSANMGFYLVRPDCRGRGVGKALRKRAEHRLQGCTVCTYTPEYLEPRFLRQGFAPSYTVVRCKGDAGGVLSVDPFLIPLTDVPFKHLVDFDATFYSASREAFLASWITRPGVVALGVLQDGHLAGYGVIRQACHGFRIGPLYAVHPSHAHRLYKALRAYGGQGPVYIDLPLENPHSQEFMETFELTPGERWISMYRGDEPAKPLSGLYGITAMELG